MQPIENITISFFGDQKVGKTCIIKSYGSNQFDQKYRPSIYSIYEANLLYSGKQILLRLQYEDK